MRPLKMNVRGSFHFSWTRKLNEKKLFLLSILPVIIVSLSILYWYIKPMPGEVFLGFVQAEQPVYLVLSKEIATEGRFIFYSSPYAIEEDFPKIYTHLLPLLLGYTWKLTGISLQTLWWLTRLIFGPIMFLLAFQILRLYITNEKYLVAGAIMLGLSGGLAYLHAFLRFLLFGDDFFIGWMVLEQTYDWWFTNLFRVTYYPLELFAHVLFFSSVLFLLRKQYSYSAVAFLLTWWAHPFAGALLTTIYIAFFAIETAVYKKDMKKIAFPFLGISLLFISYYLIVIPSNPLAKELMTSFRFLPISKHLAPGLYPSAWGIFLFLPLLYGRKIFREEKTRFLLYWVLVNIILINHDLLIQPGFQPMHFTRGYFFFPLCILSLLGLKTLLQGNKNLNLILAILIVLSLPDTVLFVYKFVTLGGDGSELELPHIDKSKSQLTYHTSPLRITETQWDVLKKLQGMDKEVILAKDNMTNFLIPLYTNHKTPLGHIDYVPHFDEKMNNSIGYFETMNEGLIEDYGVSIAVHIKPLRTGVNTSKIIYENRDYALIKVFK